jgi:hypothetical protein
MDFLISKPWLSEIGLLLDAIAFCILSIDLIKTMHGERLALDQVQELERKVFNGRYGVFAPDAAELQRQKEQFEQQQATRLQSAKADMAQRRRWALAAIALAALGFGLQIWGAWP